MRHVLSVRYAGCPADSLEVRQSFTPLRRVQHCWYPVVMGIVRCDAGAVQGHPASPTAATTPVEIWKRGCSVNNTQTYRIFQKHPHLGNTSESDNSKLQQTPIHDLIPKQTTMINSSHRCRAGSWAHLQSIGLSAAQAGHGQLRFPAAFV